VVATNNGTSYLNAYTNYYVYDGWNCMAILNGARNLQNSFLWGNDLSRTMQGAGGVGGLLKTTYYGAATTNAFVAHDGNGNVIALLDAATGTPLANYAYGPFGEQIESIGPMASANPMGWSDKIGDPETGFSYYGYRY
jgi:hypothetical protein